MVLTPRLWRVLGAHPDAIKREKNRAPLAFGELRIMPSNSAKIRSEVYNHDASLDHEYNELIDTQFLTSRESPTREALKIWPIGKQG